jgi:hypothetical protein
VAQAKAKLRSDPTTGGLFTSFRDLPQMFANSTIEILELAMYHQGLVRTGSYEQDGTYHLRSDLGGAPAFHEGVESVHTMGRKVMLYVASISTRKDSDLFNGTRLEDWLMLERPGHMYDIGYPNGVSMCFGYKPWQDHLAEVCRRLLRETGVDGIRLDEFGTPAVACFNPAHHHASPFDGIQWGLEFLRRVRAAMDEVNPGAVLMTEGSCDFMHQHSDAGGLQMYFPGRDIEAIRLAMPTFRGPSYSQGAVETALNGWVGSTANACRTGTFPGYGQWYPAKPANYPENGGHTLRWQEVRPMFHEAIVRGTPTDVDPLAPHDPQWVGRLWRAPSYWLMVGGHLDASALSAPREIQLPGLPETVRCAYEFNLQTLQVEETQLRRDGTGVFVTVTHGFGAVLLPTPNCPAMVMVDASLPTVTVGGETQMVLQLFSPWRNCSQARVKVEAAGLQVTPCELTLPGIIKLKATVGTRPGMYALKVAGETLPLKRWFRVKD